MEVAENAFTRVDGLVYYMQCAWEEKIVTLLYLFSGASSQISSMAGCAMNRKIFLWNLVQTLPW